MKCFPRGILIFSVSLIFGLNHSNFKNCHQECLKNQNTLITVTLKMVVVKRYIIRKLPESHMQKKYIINEDDNIIRVHSTSIKLLIFMSDILFSVYVR